VRTFVVLNDLCPRFRSASCNGGAFSEALHTAVLVFEAIVCGVLLYMSVRVDSIADVSFIIRR